MTNTYEDLLDKSRPKHILRLMQARDGRQVKNGIQAAYEYLRINPQAAKGFVDEVRAALSLHLTTQDPSITPWIYSAISVLRDEQYRPYLRSQLVNHEFDPVNRVWAVASLATVADDYKSTLNEISEDISLPYRLAGGLYLGNAVDVAAVRSATNTDDRLTHICLSLLFSEGRPGVPVELVKELTSSRDAEVAQYALFALHKRPKRGIEDINIGPQDVFSAHSRVRRWFYQLLLKDPSNLTRYRELLLLALERESNTQAREGLAKGFHQLKPSGEWIDLIRGWAEVETDPYVLDALGQIHWLTDILRRRSPADALSVFHAASRSSSLLRGAERGTVVIGELKGSLYVDQRDQRDQSVRVSGTGHTIGAVQGADSSAEVTQDVTNQQQVAALEMVQLLRRIADQLKRADDPRAEDIEILAEDLEQDTRSRGRAGRVRARLRQATLALGALVGVSTEMNTLVEQAEHLIHTLT